MYAIIKHGGKQYKIMPNTEVILEKIDANKGDKVDLSKLGSILMVSDNGSIKTEAGELGKIKISATVMGHFQNDKVIAFKYKSKKNYRRKKGHRQLQTRVLVDTIEAAAAKAPKTVKAKAEPAGEKSVVKKNVKTETKKTAE